MAKECLWYNGETGCYELMDFNPDDMTKEELSERIEGWLRRRYMLNPEEIKKAKETVYLVDPEHLKEAR